MFFIKIASILFAIIQTVCACDLADVRFEVEKGSGKGLTIRAFEGSTSLFSQTVDQTFRSTLLFGQNVFSRHGTGYKILYNGRDETSLTVEVDEEGNISLGDADEQTGFERRKSWGFKTPGVIRHLGCSLFYNLLTHAREFHNYGVLKSYTGTLRQNYLFNGGIIHFGDDTPFVSLEAYASCLGMVDPTAQPTYEAGIIDDRGVLLADNGLRITNLTHRPRGLVDIGGQGLEVQNAGIDNHASMNVRGPIRGNLHHFSNHSLFYADSLQRSSLTIHNWANSGQVYLSSGSDIFSQESWNNTGNIFIRGPSSVGCRKKPLSFGAVISDEEIKAIIDEALDDAAFKEVFGKAAFISRRKKVVLDVLRHTDHYLNTITRHHVDGRYTHSTETGYIFQHRTTERTQKEIETGDKEFPAEAAQTQQELHGKRDFLSAFKQSLKEKLKKLSRIHANQKGVLAALMKGLKEAGLSDDELEEIFSEGDVQGFVGLAASYDQATPEGQRKLQSELPEIGSFLSRMTSQAQSLGIPVWQWVQRNGFEFVDGFCNLAIAASRLTPHPVVAVPARVCTFGQMAPKVSQHLQKAHAFFSKRHDGGAGKSGGGRSDPQRVTNPPKAESQIWKDLKPYKGEIRTNGLEGKDKRLYQWDHLHNEIEMYDRHGKPVDALDPRTGARLFKDVTRHQDLKL
jgi:hypothetical protein